MRSKAQLQGVLVRVGMVLSSILFSFLILEGIARLVYTASRRQANTDETITLYQRDAILEWMHVPNQRMIVQTDDGSVEIEINSQGLRDSEYDYEKPDGTFRILVLGDSYTEALQVNLADAFHSILEHKLNEQVSPATGLYYEVISGGVAAYGTTRELVFYEEEGRRYQPDMVLLAYYIENDMQDDHPALAQEEPFPGIYREQFFRLDEDGQLVEYRREVEEGIAPGAAQAEAQATSTIGRIDSWFYSHMRLYFYVRPFLAEQVPFIRGALFRAGFVQSPTPVVPRYADVDAATFAEAWEIEAALIQRLKADVEGDEARFGVIIIPDYVQIQPETLKEDYPLFYPAMLDHMDLERPDQQLVQILSEERIVYLRLYETFLTRRAETGDALYGASSRHWNITGHALAAETIFDWLVIEGLLVER